MLVVLQPVLSLRVLVQVVYFVLEMTCDPRCSKHLILLFLFIMVLCMHLSDILERYLYKRCMLVLELVYIPYTLLLIFTCDFLPFFHILQSLSRSCLDFYTCDPMCLVFIHFQRIDM